MHKAILSITLTIVMLLPACGGPAPTRAPLPASPAAPSPAPATAVLSPEPTASPITEFTATSPAPTPTQPSADTGLLALLDRNGQVRIVSLDNGAVVEAGMGSQLLGWSPSGAYLLIRRGNSYAVLDEGGQQIFDTGVLPQDPQWAPGVKPEDNEDWLSVPGADGALDLVSFPSENTFQMFQAGELGEDGQAAFRWSGGGYVTITQSLAQLQKGTQFGEIFQFLSTNGPAPQNLTLRHSDNLCCGSFTISRDYQENYDLPLGVTSSGQRVLVLSAQVPQACSSCAADGLALVSQDGSGWLRVSTGAVMLPSQEAYAWNPLQTGLLALAEGSSRFTFERKRLALLDLWAGTLTYLTGEDRSIFEPAWSPDGRSIAYAALPARSGQEGSEADLENALGSRAIHVYYLSAGQDRALTNPGAAAIDGWPRWLADGQALLFARKLLPEASAQVLVVDLKTGQEQLVAELENAPEFCHRGCGWDQMLAFTPGRVQTPPEPATVLAPTPTPEVLPGEPGPGWNIYRNTGYGFEFQYPDGWQVDAPFPSLPNFIQATRDSYALTIGFRRPGQNAVIGRSGTGAGDFQPGGQVTFMGQPLKCTLLVYGGKVKAVFYHSACEFAAGELFFTLSLDSLDVQYEKVDIPEDVQSEVDQMIESFKDL